MNEGLRSLWTVLSEPFLNPQSRTYFVGLLAFLGVAAVVALRKSPKAQQQTGLRAAVRHPSTLLDVQLLLGRQMLRAVVGVPTLASGWFIATRGVRWLDHTLGVPATPDLPPLGIAALYTLTLFVVWDLSRFLLHALMHKVPFLWSIHQVHHSAEVLTPLTFHRIHPIESWLYDLRGALSTGLVAGLFYYLFRGIVSHFTLLGVPAIGLVLNVATGNLRHSHVWIPFPPAVERWFLSPAQHQIHHSADKAHHGRNYGTWLAIWDRLFGTWLPARQQPQTYGLSSSERNHGNHLLSAWFDPLKGALPVVALAVLFGLSTARAEDPNEESTADERTESSEDDDPENNDRYGEEMFIYEDGRAPRVAGSAHRVDEEALERFEYSNIEQVMQQVPGVSTRNEDGFGLRPNIGIRGANSDRSAKISLMEDGVLLAPAPYAAPAAYYFPMSSRLVGVEVFKGPSSTRHGPYTVGGAVNLLTRAIPEQRSAHVDASMGLFQTTKLHMWSGGLTDSAGMLFEGIHLRSSGFKTLDGGGDTGFERSEFMLKSEWLPSVDQRLELKLGYAAEDGNETYLGLSASDFEATPYRRYAASAMGLMSWQRTQAELEWTGKIGSAIRFRSVAYHHFLDRSWEKFNGFASGVDSHSLLKDEPGGQGAVYLAILRGEEDSISEDQMLQIGDNHRTFHSFGWQNTAEWAVHGERFSSRLEAGLRLHGDHVRRLHTEVSHAMQSGQLTPTGEEQTSLDGVATAQALAAHLHEDLSMGRWHFFPGLRLETVRTERIDEGVDAAPPQLRATLLPGAGLLVEATSVLDLFVGSHRGFSPVAPGQHEEALPEQSWNTEAGFRIDKGLVHAEVVGFFNDYSNITGQCTFSAGCSGEQIDQQFNGGAAHVYGAEAVFGTDLPAGAQLSVPLNASYALTQGHFTTSFNSSFSQYGQVQAGDVLPYVATHQAHLQAGLRHSRWSLNVGMSYRSAMLDRAGNLGEADIPELLLVDASAHFSLARDWELYATGTNLTGATAVTSWRPFGARPAAPLQIMAGIKWSPRANTE